MIGVMPRSFSYPDGDVEIWAPSPPDAPYAQRRDETWFSVIGRMKPGVTVPQAAGRSRHRAGPPRQTISQARRRTDRGDRLAQKHHRRRLRALALAPLRLRVVAAAHRLLQHRRAPAGPHRRARARNFHPLFARSIATRHRRFNFSRRSSYSRSSGRRRARRRRRRGARVPSPRRHACPARKKLP